jgi:hypothetical protein
MDKKYKDIIEQATKLAERAIPAFEAEKKLQEVEPLFDQAQAKIASLEKEASEKEEKFRSKADKMANVLVTRGILDESQKVAFVESVTQDHSELADVVIKLSSELKAEQFGKVGEENPDQAELDPFERLALEK